MKISGTEQVSHCSIFLNNHHQTSFSGQPPLFPSSVPLSPDSQCSSSPASAIMCLTSPASNDRFPQRSTVATLGPTVITDAPIGILNYHHVLPWLSVISLCKSLSPICIPILSSRVTMIISYQSLEIIVTNIYSNSMQSLSPIYIFQFNAIIVTNIYFNSVQSLSPIYIPIQCNPV